MFTDIPLLTDNLLSNKLIFQRYQIFEQNTGNIKIKVEEMPKMFLIKYLLQT